MRTALVGKPTVRFDAPSLVGPRPVPGRIVERVDRHGRHLELTWDDGIVLHTNLRMSGSWHLYRDGERWRQPAARRRVEIATPGWVAVCFGAPVVETYRRLDRTRHPGRGPLGPDLSQPDADVDECINRLYHHLEQSAPVAEALLDEHVATGIGNVFRCEALWAVGLHPAAPVGSLDGEDCARLIEAAARLLRSNLRQPGARTGPLVTQALAVYGRNGQPCVRCGDTVGVVRAARNRSLYWCEACQQHRSPVVTAPEEPQREMDPHPAAVKFLHDLPWRRTG